jgi:glycosyltransferase involved in cell wall biosynthesis
MRPSFHHTKVGVKAPVPKWRSIRERLFCKLLKLPELRAVYTIDELLAPYIEKIDPSLIQRLQYLPDPAELPNNYNQATARARLNLSTEEFVILVYGAIDERKGIHFLLNAVRGQIFAKPLRLLVAGKHTPAMTDFLGREPLVTSIDQYVDAEVEEAVFRAADVVWLGYQGHYAMSGVLILSSAAGKSTIATQEGLIGWMTEKYVVGTAIDCNNHNQINQSIKRHIENRNLPQFSAMKTLSLRHTWSNFCNLIKR